MKTLSERLKYARNQVAKLSQKELSERSGLAQQTISKLERGDACSTTGMVSLARACGVDPVWLADGVGQPIASSVPLVKDESDPVNSIKLYLPSQLLRDVQDLAMDANRTVPEFISYILSRHLYGVFLAKNINNM